MISLPVTGHLGAIEINDHNRDSKGPDLNAEKHVSGVCIDEHTFSSRRKDWYPADDSPFEHS